MHPFWVPIERDDTMPKVPISSRLVLAFLTLDHPKTIIKVCQDTGLAAITTQRSLQDLVRLGLVVRNYRPHYPATYKLAQETASHVF